MVQVKHNFHSNKDDGTDSQLVGPTKWNEDHVITAAAGGVVLGRAEGAGAGAVQELAISSIGSTMPPGSLVAFAGLSVPTGWYFCDGSLKSTTTDAALFAACQYAFGGSGGSFAVPDLRGRVLAGPDGGMNRLPGYTVPGVASGAATAQANVGGVGINIDNADWYVNDPSGRTSAGPDAESINTSGSGGGSTFEFPNKLHTHQFSINGAIVNMSGSMSVTAGSLSTAFAIVQPTMAMNWIIKR